VALRAVADAGIGVFTRTVSMRFRRGLDAVPIQFNPAKRARTNKGTRTIFKSHFLR
jgi:hypothetical protein